VLLQWLNEVNQAWSEANAQSAEYSWVPTLGVGYMNLGTSEYDLQKNLKPIRDERDLIIGAATLNSVIASHAKAREQFRKHKLNAAKNILRLGHQSLVVGIHSL
jgi:hypothetical protein